MTTITLRGTKGSPLTNAEVDNNFENLNTYKVEQTSATGAAALPTGTTAQRPASPVAGNIRYNASTGKFEGYGSAWGNIGGGAAIGDAAPSNPGAGDLWWNSLDGHLYVYYSDVDTSQWVDAFAGGEGQYLPLTGGTISGNLAYTGTLTGGTGIINIGSGQIYKDAAGKFGINTNTPDSDLDVNGGGQRLFKAKAISRLGLPNLGTYKGYLLLAKAYTSGTVDQSHVNGTFYLKRGSTGSGNRTDVYVVSSNTAYSTDNLFVQVTATASKLFLRTCKVIYGGIWYHAIETTVDGGEPDNGVWFTGTFSNCAPIYVDATYVSSITDYGSWTGAWNADGAGNGSVLELNNGVISLPKGQLKFPATQNPSSDANTLDDYEEGTWTPVYLGSSGNPTVAYNYQNGTYVKIGKLVMLSFELSTNSASGGGGSLQIGGFPFVATGTRYQGGLTIGFSTGWASSGFAPRQGYVYTGWTQAYLTYLSANYNQTEISVGNLASTGGNYVIGHVVYMTS